MGIWQCLVWFRIVLVAYGFLYYDRKSYDRKSVFWHSHFSFHLCPFTFIFRMLAFHVGLSFLHEFLFHVFRSWLADLDLRLGHLWFGFSFDVCWCILVYSGILMSKLCFTNLAHLWATILAENPCIIWLSFSNVLDKRHLKKELEKGENVPEKHTSPPRTSLAWVIVWTKLYKL